MQNDQRPLDRDNVTGDYRQAIYARYRSAQGFTQKPDLGRVMWWAAPYDLYLAGWLPADKEARIADVACGGGYLLYFLSQKGYRNLVGTDISREQVALAQQLHANVCEEDALKFLGRHEAAFDLILAVDIIEHLNKAEVIRFLSGAFQALRPGGRLVVQTPNCGCPFGIAQRFADFTHEIGLTPNSMAWLLRLHGFQQIEHREQGPVIRGGFSFIRWCLWRVIRWGYLLHDLVETGSSGRVFTRVFITAAVKPPAAGA